MPAKRILTDPAVVKAVVDEYILDKKPTLSGLLIKLGLKHLASLHKYMGEDSEIGELLCTAYLHLVYSHEIKMYDSKATPSIYYLKTLHKLGFNFSDQPEDTSANNKQIIELVIRDKDANPTNINPSVTPAKV